MFTVGEVFRIKALLHDIRLMAVVSEELEKLDEVWKQLGVDASKLYQSSDKLAAMEAEVNRFVSLIDEFNSIFVPRGWVFYELLDMNLIIEATSMANNGSIDEAEEKIAAYYSPQRIAINLQWMRRIKAFQPRMRLAELALNDYTCERFHACIPVVLALIDGFTSDLNKGYGFFASEVKLEAWDSLSANATGLVSLGRVFRKTRRITVTDEIFVPYRNGIMHGTDLGYDNLLVAAKTWALLFALSDWGQRAENNALSAHTRINSEWIFKSIRKPKKVVTDLEALKAWKTRTSYEKNFPSTGNTDVFTSGSPEHRLVEFFSAWQKRNFKDLSESTFPTSQKTPSVSIDEIRKIYGTKILNSFEILESQDVAQAATHVTVRLVFLQDNKETVLRQMYKLL